MFMRGQYLAIMMPSHHLACKDGYVYIHRLKAEEKLGRKLKPGECVHHIDENKLNNELDNLMIFKTKADHTAFHQGCEIKLDGDVYIAEMHTSNICPVCGGYKERAADLCIKCRCLARRKVQRPTKDELMNLIISFPFTQIGRMYGVSDNAIRKWCKSYNLPYRRNDIDNL